MALRRGVALIDLPFSVTSLPSSIIAVIDTTEHPDDVPPETVIGGLSLLERALRLAEVCGFDRAIVLCRSSSHPELGALAAERPRKIPVEVVASRSPALRDRLDAVHDALPRTASPLVWFSSSTVFERRLIIAAKNGATNGATKSATLVALSDRELVPNLFAIAPEAWPLLLDAREGLTSQRLDALVDAVDRPGISVQTTAETGWAVPIGNARDGRRAEDRLWQSCRKDVDGLVARHLNRYVSLAISRRIATTGITPNHISVLTFTMGIIAAVLAGIGGYWAFFLAGVLYQINSIVDGVDGELARTKYEFSLLGEWLDTLSDDLSDLFIYVGLGIGAWRTVASPFAFVGPELWLYLSGLAALGKIVTMALYYRWLIAHKRGDLLSFQWSFEAEGDSPPSSLQRGLQLTKYFFKKDFIVFVAMLMAIIGAFPFMLFLFGPGNAIVAVSVALQSAPSSTRPESA